MLSSEEQPSNAEEPIEVTLDGMVMLVNEVQALNAAEPIEVTLDGIIMLLSDLQLSNAEEPIVLSWLPSAKVMLSSEVQSSNA